MDAREEIESSIGQLCRPPHPTRANRAKFRMAFSPASHPEVCQSPKIRVAATLRALLTKVLPVIASVAARADAATTAVRAALIIRKNMFSPSLCTEVSQKRLELLTSWSGTTRSILLSYWDMVQHA